MHKRKLLLKVVRHLRPEENSFFSRSVRSENALKDSPRETSLRYEGNRICAQAVEILNLDDLRVASPCIKRGRTNRYTTLYNMLMRSARKSLDGSRSQQRSETSAVKPPASADVGKKMTAENNKTTEDTQQSLEAECRPLVHLGLD